MQNVLEQEGCTAKKNIYSKMNVSQTTFWNVNWSELKVCQALIKRKIPQNLEVIIFSL